MGVETFPSAEKDATIPEIYGLPSNSSTVEFNFDETVKYSRFSHFSLYRFEYLSMNGYFFKNFIHQKTDISRQ